MLPNFYFLNANFIKLYTSPPRNLRDIFCVQCRCPCKTAKHASATQILFVGILIVCVFCCIRREIVFTIIMHIFFLFLTRIC